MVLRVYIIFKAILLFSSFTVVLQKFVSSLDGIWTHTIDTLQHHSFSLTSSALLHSTTSTPYINIYISHINDVGENMHPYILYPTRDEDCDFGKYPLWRFNPIFSTLTSDFVDDCSKRQSIRNPLYYWFQGLLLFYIFAYCAYIRLKIKPNSVRIRFLSCQFFFLPSTWFELTPLIHCNTIRLALRPAPYATRPHPLHI
jgi:hypothetical protein